MLTRRFISIGALVMCGCAGWAPVRNAREIEQGQRVKVERAERVVFVGEVAPCDSVGFVLAKQWIDCRVRSLTFDVRRDKVFVYEDHTATLVVAGILLGSLSAFLAGFAIRAATM